MHCIVSYRCLVSHLFVRFSLLSLKIHTHDFNCSVLSKIKVSNLNILFALEILAFFYNTYCFVILHHLSTMFLRDCWNWKTNKWALLVKPNFFRRSQFVKNGLRKKKNRELNKNYFTIQYDQDQSLWAFVKEKKVSNENIYSEFSYDFGTVVFLASI